MTELTDLTNVAIVTTIATLSGLALSWFKQPPIIGYIIAGVLLGPTGIGLVQDSHMIHFLAELGVLMLLFIIGMELNIKAFRKIIFTSIGCVFLQTIFFVFLFFSLGSLFGWSVEKKILFSFVSILSSTAISIKILEDIGELKTPAGQLTVGVMIAQDLAVVPMLIILNNLGGESFFTWSLFIKMGLAFVILSGLIYGLSRVENLKLPQLKHFRKSPDLIPLGLIAFCFILATISGLLGLSTAYGAFIAGLILSVLSERKSLIRITHPTQSLLLMIFFLSVGLMIDLTFIIENIWSLILLLFIVTLIKTISNIGFLKILGKPWQQAFLAGVVMGQIGEFSFVISAVGLNVGIISMDLYKLAITVIALSIMFSPLWHRMAQRIHDILADDVKDLAFALSILFEREIKAYHFLKEKSKSAVDKIKSKK